MRVVSKHFTALDRQVSESVRINEEMTKDEACLNLKSEWGGSKIPNINVMTPKGTALAQHKNGMRNGVKVLGVGRALTEFCSQQTRGSKRIR